MRTTKHAALYCGLALVASSLAAVPAQAGFGDSDQERQARWIDIQKALFNGKTAKTDDAVVTLDAPDRALDASLVPIAIGLKDPKSVKGLYLVIDDNPAPVAAHFDFGPGADPREIKLRVRVNTYTNVHAVAEMRDGTLIQTTKFVKASGGCSAPMGMSDEEAMKGMGDMRIKFASDVATNKPVDTMLMIRHPNFNGMQMNQVTRDYTPARYIQTIAVSDGGRKVFDMDTDISLASNPVINFVFIPTDKSQLKVDVTDSAKGHWEKTVPVPALSN